VVEIIFNFFLIDKDREKYYIDKWSTLPLLIKSNTTKLEKFDTTLGGGSHSLPPNQDYNNWGLVLASSDILNLSIIMAPDSTVYRVDTSGPTAGSTQIEIIKGQQTILTFTDSYYSDDIFIRRFDKFTYYIKGGKIILKIKELKTSFLTTLEPKELASKVKVVTFDLETITDKTGLMTPYLYSMYNGDAKFSWFNDSPEELFNELLRSKYHGYSVYAHNLSRFDLVFLFKYLAKIAQEGIYSVDIIKKDDQVKSIKISNIDRKISITLKDSYLLLPASLAALANLFLGADQSKTKEPVFIGDPSSPYYTHNLDTYTKEVEKVTDLNEWKDKVREYCVNDSVILYDIIIKFRALIWDKWGIDATNYPTITSLAFTNFRQNYLEEDTIPIVKSKAYDFIRESYTGGSTEMYKPNPDGPVHCYDVNGLYPSQMANWGMPTGPIRQFEGDVTILDQDKYYWVGDAQVSTKKDLYQPYLQVHQMTPQGFRTIAPNGTFRMKINSCEYFNALKDYDIQVRSGFLFDKTNIFSDYINDMYYLRLQYPKGHPMNTIAKLMANSLYGRFALNPVLENHKFCSWDEFKELSETCNIIEEMTLGEDSMFTSYVNKEDTEGPIKSSIAIASAVTASARVEMSKYKNNPNFVLYYTDTDSIFINKPLPDHMVGSGLGQMKLEYIFKDCVFLGPKIYTGITEDGKYICKIKGYKDASSVPLDALKKLLIKEGSLKLKHNKWFRNLAESNILIKEQLYELSKTEKR
jgi:DNA polymerase type B, organellar and viral